jgi:hypothetical protein
MGSLVTGLFFGGNTVTGLPRSHSPFFLEENYILPLNICNHVARTLENVHPALGSVTFTAPDGLTLILTMSSLRNPYTEQYYAKVIQGGRVIAPTIQVPLVSTVVSLLPTKAICHDLNGDGTTDFLTDHSRHGNGLGARFYDRLVILSSSTGGYRFWILQTMDPSPEDYVTFGALEKLAMVTTSFANSGGAIPHSYYVYDLWSFRDGELVPANNVDPRFPKWVWMTLTENHKPANSLSQEEKQIILNPKRAKEVRVIELN